MAEVSEAAAERKPTERVVLERMVALRIPVDASEEQVQAAVAALYPKARKSGAGVVGEAWSEVARQTAATKTAAIEAHAGKPGTPDAKIGTWRAPTLTSWKGAVVHEAPPAPLVQRSLLD